MHRFRVSCLQEVHASQRVLHLLARRVGSRSLSMVQLVVSLPLTRCSLTCRYIVFSHTHVGTHNSSDGHWCLYGIYLGGVARGMLETARAGGWVCYNVSSETRKEAATARDSVNRCGWCRYAVQRSAMIALTDVVLCLATSTSSLIVCVEFINNAILLASCMNNGWPETTKKLFPLKQCLYRLCNVIHISRELQ